MTPYHLNQRVSWARTLPGSSYVEHLRAVVVKLSETRVCIKVRVGAVMRRLWVRQGSLRSRR